MGTLYGDNHGQILKVVMHGYVLIPYDQQFVCQVMI